MGKTLKNLGIAILCIGLLGFLAYGAFIGFSGIEAIIYLVAGFLAVIALSYTFIGFGYALNYLDDIAKKMEEISTSISNSSLSRETVESISKIANSSLLRSRDALMLLNSTKANTKEMLKSLQSISDHISSNNSVSDSSSTFQ